MFLQEEHLSIPLWCHISGLTEKDLATQIIVHASELIEGFDGILSNDPQEIMDGVVDVDWMCEVADTLSNGNVNLRPHYEQLVAWVETKYPGLIAEHLVPFKREVLLSNFSKFCVSEEDVKLSVEKFANIGVEVYVLEVDGFRCIRSLNDQIGSDGVHYSKDKILKGIKYFKPKYKVE